MKTAEPIGSKTILNHKNIKFSPATIRNECVVLEKKNLIQKLHLSSGRIPSTKGYRYYIENLISNENIDPIKDRIEKIFIDRSLAVDDILEKTSEIISEMTNLTALVIGSGIKNERLKKIELLPLDNEKAVVIIALSNGHVENRIFHFTNISLSDLKITVDLFNKRLENSLISDIPEKFKLLYPILKKQVKKYEFILQEFLSTITSISKVKKTTHGIQYMLKNPEFNNSDTIKHAIKLIESISSFEFFHRMSLSSDENSDSIIIKIGDELKNNEFNDISLISTNYKLNNSNEESSLALVGPKRIEYNKILKLLNWFSCKLKEYSLEKEEENAK